MPLASAGYPRRWLDGVPGGFGVVGAPGWGGPAERPVGQLVDLPAGLLLEPVVVSALRTVLALPYNSLSWENSFGFRLSATDWKLTPYQPS